MVTPLVERRTWKLVAPSYREHQQPEPHADTRPIFQKYDSSDFVTQFTADPQHSLKFNDDDRVQQRIPLPKLAALPGFANLRRRLADDRLAPGTMRKLFLDVHKRFYLLVWELRADAVGFPCIARDRVCEAGFVVRRPRLDVPETARGRMAELLAAYQSKKSAVAMLQAELAEESGASGVAATFRQQIVAAGPRAATKTQSMESLLAEATAELHAVSTQMQAEAATLGVRHLGEGWFPDGTAAGVGEWRQASPGPPVEENVFPAFPLVADPADAQHSGHGASIYFGVIPTAGSDVTAEGAPQFDETSVYEARAFVRRHDPRCRRTVGRNDCKGDVIWAKPTEQYRLAAQFDLIGTSNRPVTIQLPDFKDLEAQAAQLPPGRATPVRMNTPPDSALMIQADMDGSFSAEGVSGSGEICFFAIPLITIVAMFLLRLFLPIVTFIFGLWWMLKLKLCLPPSIDVGADFDAALDVIPPEIDFDAQFELGIVTPAEYQDALDAFRDGYDNQLTTGAGAALTRNALPDPGYSAQVLADLTRSVGESFGDDPEAGFTAGIEYEERRP